MVTANYVVGKKLFSTIFIATVSIVEGAILLKGDKFSELSNLQKTDKIVGAVNFTMDVSSLPENLKELLDTKKENFQTLKKEDGLASDNTSVAKSEKPILKKEKVVKDKKQKQTV